MKRFVVSLALALCGCANIVQHAERRYSAFCGTAEASVEFARVFSSCETYRHGYLSDVVSAIRWPSCSRRSSSATSRWRWSQTC